MDRVRRYQIAIGKARLFEKSTAPEPREPRNFPDRQIRYAMVILVRGKLYNRNHRFSCLFNALARVTQSIAAGNKNFVTRQAEEERTFYKSFTIFLAVFLQVSSARTRGALVGVWGLGEGHRSRLLPLHSRACPVSEASGEIYHAPMQKKARHSRLSKASILASDVVEPSASSITGHARWKSCRFYR